LVGRERAGQLSTVPTFFLGCVQNELWDRRTAHQLFGQLGFFVGVHFREDNVLQSTLFFQRWQTVFLHRAAGWTPFRADQN
jgi:hypothetical protein